MRTNLQIPLDKSLRDNAAAVAYEQGFSTLQDAVRVFLTQLAQKKVAITISQQTPDEILTPKQEAVLTKKYQRALKSIKANEGFLSENAKDLIDNLDKA